MLSVGELQDRKNHIVAIEALHQLNLPNVCYIIAGRGELKDKYEKLIAQYGMNGTVRLLGYRNDIDQLCAAADCFVHPSIREGFGIAPMEAMVSGLPLITADINGMKDYTKDGVTGCCVDPRSVEEVSTAIRWMYEDPVFRRECGRNNREIAKKYGVDVSKEKVLSIINGAW